MCAHFPQTRSRFGVLERAIVFYENGQVKWLAEQPQVISARIIVTVLEETKIPSKRRTSSAKIAGKAKTLSDLVSPIVDDQDWECLK